MSNYNQGSITRIIDPIIDVANNRVEFRLPSNTLLSANVRILNIGAVVDTAITTYNRMAGGLSLIKNIYLQNNGETLDQILDCNSWIAFKEHQKSHAEAQSVSSTLVGNRLGLEYDALNQIKSDQAKQLGITLATSGKCMLNLKNILPFFQASQVIPTRIFTDLRLIIEYETDLVKISADTTNPLTNVMLNPFLSVEEILDQSLIASMTADYQGITFRSVERDLATLSTTKATVDVAVGDVGFPLDSPNVKVNNKVALLKGFDNKYLSRIVVMPKSLEATGYKNGEAVNGGGGLGAIALLRPTFNVVVNGANKLAGTGLTSHSEIQARCIDTWGDTCISLQANAPAVWNPEAAGSATAKTGCYSAFREYVGYAAYIGLDIEEFIQNLSINIGYTAQKNSASATPADANFDVLNSDYHLLVFGECRKSIRVANGSYIVSYM